MLYDGAITLESDGYGLVAEGVELNAPMQVGATVTMTINGHDYEGTVTEDEQNHIISVEYEDGDTYVSLASVNGVVGFGCSTDVASEGENTLKVVQSEE